jgi:hypothetical protein
MASALSVGAGGADWLVWEGSHLLHASAPTKKNRKLLMVPRFEQELQVCRIPESGIGAQSTGSGVLPCAQ